MSGFHPVLGLLAVAVCISFVEAAVIPLIPNHDASANKPQASNSARLLAPRMYDNVQARALHKKERTPLSEYKNGQNADIIAGRNAAYNNQAGVFGQVDNLRRAGEDDLRAQAIGADSASGTLEEHSGQDGLVSGGDRSKYEESASVSSEESQSGGGGASDDSGFRSQISKSEEECKDDEETEKSTVGTPTATTSSPTSQPVSNPDTEGSASGTSSESSESDEPVEDSTPNQGTEECDPDEETTIPSTDGGDETTSTTSTPNEEGQDCEESGEVTDAVTTTKTTTTTTTKKPKKPADDNTSSGSFWDSDSEGVKFSESNSKESEGDSTNLSWGR